MPQEDPDRIVHCVKLKEDLPGLKTPPFPNDLGKMIFEKVSKKAWDMWLEESVRFINTYRVDLSSKEGTEFLIKQMKVWLEFEEGELAETAWVAPEEGEEDSNNAD